MYTIPRKTGEILRRMYFDYPSKRHFRQVLNCDTRFRRYLDDEDLMRFMQEEEAIRALALFDGAMESGKITKKALKSWVVRNSCTECGPL